MRTFRILTKEDISCVSSVPQSTKSIGLTKPPLITSRQSLGMRAPKPITSRLKAENKNN